MKLTDEQIQLLSKALPIVMQIAQDEQNGLARDVMVNVVGYLIYVLGGDQ